jgi:hypothetical protein
MRVIQSDTPRTDAAKIHRSAIYGNCDPPEYEFVVTSSFTSELERELGAALARIKVLEQDVEDLDSRSKHFLPENARLQNEFGALLRFTRLIAHKLNAVVGLNDDEVAYLNGLADK